MSASDREIRAGIFEQLAKTEEDRGVTFFVVLLDPDVYVYHKKDSDEFSMALCTQTVAAISLACGALDVLPKPGKMVVEKATTYYPWWKVLCANMQRASTERGWHWFIVAMEGLRTLFVAETPGFPMLPTDRCELLKTVNVLWDESQLADVEYAKDAFLSSIVDTSRYAASECFRERRGVRLI